MCDEKKPMCSACHRNFLNQTLSQFRKREAANDDDKVVWVHEDSRGGIDAQGQAGKYLTRLWSENPLTIKPGILGPTPKNESSLTVGSRVCGDLASEQLKDFPRSTI
ncbi:hypothetical protein JA9_004992 [Meyerozyma sp. JA9]|nr:hypothetical protein JA9_004992 [Meyerozyma sp. JA9]